MPPVDRNPTPARRAHAVDAPAASQDADLGPILREPESVYLGRQPIIDRNGALHAYELLVSR